MKMSYQYPSQKLSMNGATSQIYRKDLDTNDKMKSLIDADRQIIEKFKSGKFNENAAYLEHINKSPEWKAKPAAQKSKQTYTDIKPVRSGLIS